MKEEYGAAIAQALQWVPDGKFAIKKYDALGRHRILLMEQLKAQSEGKGRIETFQIFPGIEVSFQQYWAEQVHCQHAAIDSILEMNHCRTGRIGWNMRGGASIYLGAGDLCLHTKDCCADSDMLLPLGYYEGITFTVDLKVLEQNKLDILEEAGMPAELFYQKFCAAGKPLAIPANIEIEQIFSMLYDLPEPLQLPYCKLKAQEILLYLGKKELDCEKGLSQYVSQQTELIKEIHDFLIQHLDERFTIEELSKKYLINTSSLKSIFKAVYGAPLASYVKEYRMRQAMKLLRETDDSIAMIAEKVGYETQGKFTKVFKERKQILPTEYRRLFQK